MKELIFRSANRICIAIGIVNATAGHVQGSILLATSGIIAILVGSFFLALEKERG